MSSNDSTANNMMVYNISVYNMSSNNAIIKNSSAFNMTVINMTAYNISANNLTFSNTNDVTHSCMGKPAGVFAIFLALMVCPVYILMLKILIHDFNLGHPRYRILLSLNISDSIQIAGGAFLSILSYSFLPRSDSVGCQVIRKLFEFLGISTVVMSSGSILLLTFERYVACVHSLRFYDIVTDDRVSRALYCIWVVAILCGLIDKERYEPNYTAMPLVFTKAICVIYTIVVFGSSIILTCVQIRLYLLSRKKMKVLPFNNFGRAAEENDRRKAEMKVAIVASAVVGLYMICMCPLAFYIISAGFDDTNNDVSAFRVISIMLLAVNTVADPFVYGFGMSDTRQKIMTELRKIKLAIVDMISRIFNL